MIKSRMTKLPRDSDKIAMEKLAWLLDSSIPIPGTNFKIGLDAIVGLIPGVGDLIGSALSSYIVLLAAQNGVSRWTLTRMAFNILVESVVGVIPVLGDVFDAVWKSNQRNIRLLERSVLTQTGTKQDAWFLILVAFVLLASLGLAFFGAYQFIVWLVQAMRA